MRVSSIASLFLLSAAVIAHAQIGEFKTAVGQSPWNSAKKHSIVDFILTCPWLEFGDGEIALRRNADVGAVDQAEFEHRKAALLGSEVQIQDAVYDPDNDYLSLTMQSSYSFHTTFTATFFDRKGQAPVVALAYQTETPIGPDEFSYLFCETGNLRNWTRSDVLDEGGLAAFVEGVDTWAVAWECVLPQEGGDVEFIPHASTAMAGDPYEYNELVDHLKGLWPSSVFYHWNYARGSFQLR